MDDPIIKDEDLEPVEPEDDDTVIPATPLDAEDDHESLEALAEEEDEEEMDMDNDEEDEF